MPCAEVFEGQIDPGCNDTCREKPFGDLKGDDGFDLSGPTIECEEIDGSENIDSVDGGRDEERDPEVSVCERGEAGCRFKVVETLQWG